MSNATDCCLGSGLSFRNSGACRQCIGKWLHYWWYANLPSACMCSEGYSSCSVHLCVCVSVCSFSLLCLFTLLGIKQEVSAATAWEMQ